ncbi:IS701 family transposase [Streptomyces huiliensis]|uniref:IS701 family transposase n=1 Tax=Streptomyces huiliensis TaxID=2876027 RepID=UPI001CBCBE9A|nr:IS701 family transposase [Streptomyces huiliensis]MBZ4322970.1 IS701 family transposase [Streptomyces huiliensis]
MTRIAGRFARSEPRCRVGKFVRGLLADLPRKNCWTIAEWAGEPTPDGMQHLLERAKWDANAIRDDPREYVVEHLGTEQAVLVVDGTGDVKKGNATVGVQRQYTGTAGRIENSQVAVYLVHATARGHAAVDRELYLPRTWTEDPERCRAAGLDPDDVHFATKTQLAAVMLKRFWASGHSVGWVTGDEVYGGNPALLSMIAAHGSGYVMAVSCRTEVPTPAGKFRADTLMRKVPRRGWQRLSAGSGAKGPRLYDWAAADVNPSHATGASQLLIRRNRTTGELAYYRCFSPRPVPLSVLVRVAGTRWRIEETFQAGKGLAGLDEHQVRRYTPWLRWVTLAMLAHAFLAAVRAGEHHDRPASDGLIALTCNEIQRLFALPAASPGDPRDHRLRWSLWRRRHQARARNCHYRRHEATA